VTPYNTLDLLTGQGSFRGGTRRNAVPIVEKLPERMGTAFPSLKCFRKNYGQHCEPFSGQKCTILHDFAYTISKSFRGWYPWPPQKHRWCLDPNTDFRLARERSHCSSFTKRPLKPGHREVHR